MQKYLHYSRAAKEDLDHPERKDPEVTLDQPVLPDQMEFQDETVNEDLLEIQEDRESLEIQDLKGHLVKKAQREMLDRQVFLD